MWDNLSLSLKKLLVALALALTPAAADAAEYNLHRYIPAKLRGTHVSGSAYLRFEAPNLYHPHLSSRNTQRYVFCLLFFFFLPSLFISLSMVLQASPS